MAEENTTIPQDQDVKSQFTDYTHTQEYISAREELGLNDEPEGEPETIDAQVVRETQDENNLMPITPPSIAADDPLRLSFEIGMAVVESPLQVPGGVMDAVNKMLIEPVEEAFTADAVLTFTNPKVQEEFDAEVLDNMNKFPFEFGPKAPRPKKDKDGFRLPTTPQPRSKGGAVVRSLAEYGTALAASVLGLRKIPGFQKLGSAFTEVMMASPIATLMINDEEAGNLFTILNENNELNNMFLRYLADNNPENESEWESEMKDVISEIVVGAGGVMLLATMKGAKAWSGEIIKAAGDTKAGQAGKAFLKRVRDREVKLREMDIVSDDSLNALGDPESSKLFIFKEGILKTAEKAKTKGRARERLKRAREVVEDPVPAAPGSADRLEINFAALNTTFDIENLIKSINEKDINRILRKKGKPQTFQRMIQKSDTVFKDITDLIGHPPGRPMSGTETTKALVVMISMAEQVQAQAIKAKLSNQIADKVILERMKAVLTAVNLNIQGAKTEASSAIRAHGVLNSKAFREMLPREKSSILMGIADAAGGEKSLDNFIDLVVSADNPTAVIKASKNSLLMRWGRAINTYRYENMLSGPGTVRRNFLGNSFAAGWMIPERYVAAMQSQFLPFGSGQIEFGEANAMVFALGRSLKDAFLFASRSKKAANLQNRLNPHFENSRRLEGMRDQAITGDLVTDMFNMKRNSLFGRGLDLIGYIHAGPLRVGLDFPDRLFKGFVYGNHLNALAYRQARKEGTSYFDMDTRIREIVGDPPPDLHMDAIDVAKELTFTKNLEGWFRTGQEGLRRVPIIGEYLNPFMRSKVNLLTYNLRRSPFAPILKDVRADLMAGGPRTDMAIAKVETMSMLVLGLTDYALDGKIIGHLAPIFEESKDPALKSDFHKRTRQMASNVKPCSFQYDGKYYSFDRTAPFGDFVCAAGDLGQTINNVSNEEKDNLVSEFILTYWKQFDYVEMISGLVDFAAALDDRNKSRNIKEWLDAQAGQLIPWSGMLRQIRKAGDPVVPSVRSVKGDPMLARSAGEQFLGEAPDPDVPNVDPLRSAALQESFNKLKAIIPGLSAQLPARVNMYGEEIDISGGNGYMFNILLGGTIFPVDTDPFKKMMDDNKVPFANPSKVIGIDFPSRAIPGVEMTDREYIEFTRIGRGRWKKEMDEDLANGFFNGMSSGPGGEFSDYVIARGQEFDAEMREEIKILFPRIQKEIDLRNAKSQALFLGKSVTPNNAAGPPAAPIIDEAPARSVDAVLGGK